MRFESFYASFSPSLHPVTHRSFAYSQCHRDVLLLPALLFQLPGLFTSFFSPIGFLWCSHTSYGITLYFLLPLSVAASKKSLQSAPPSLTQRRAVINELREKFPVRLLCRVLTVPPSSFYYQPRMGDDLELREQIEHIALEYPRYG